MLPCKPASQGRYAFVYTWAGWCVAIVNGCYVICTSWLLATSITKYGSTSDHKREYRDGIKSKETRPRWGEAHNLCKACVCRYYGGANMCT